MSKTSYKVVMVRIDGLTATHELPDHEQALAWSKEQLTRSLWGRHRPVVKVFFAHDGQLDEMDVDAIRTMGND